MLRIRTFAVMTGLALGTTAMTPSVHGQVVPGGVPGAGGMPGPAPGMMGMGMGMGLGGSQGGAVMILLAPSVKKELKLTEDQNAKIYNLAKQTGQKSREMMQTMAFSGGNANPQMMMEARRQLQQETDQGIAGILQPKQKERFDQIVLRNEGPLAIATRPELAAKLRLNESQQEYVQGVVMQMRRDLFMEVRQRSAAGQFNPSQMRELTAQYRKEAVKELGKVIDRKQQKTFDSMLGAPFDLTKLESESAAAEASVGGVTDPTKPADAAQTQDANAPGTATEKATTKSASPPTSKKGRSRAGSGAGR
jgi:hypothetical protein